MSKLIHELFANDWDCICYKQSCKTQDFLCCFCDPVERYIRHYAYGGDFPRGLLSQEQRSHLIREADRAGEGMFRKEELEIMNDRDLCRSYMSAISAYVGSQLDI